MSAAATSRSSGSTASPAKAASPISSSSISDWYLPKVVQQAFSQVVTKVSDRKQSELQPEEIHQLFMDTYVNLVEPIDAEIIQGRNGGRPACHVTALLEHRGREVAVSGHGNGLLDAFCQALREYLDSKIEITAYHEHALERGSTSKAITYVQVQNGGNHLYIGAGISSSISRSSLRAVVSAVNQMPSVKRVMGGDVQHGIMEQN